MINHLLLFCIQVRPVTTSAERYLLIYMIAVLIIVTALVILFFIVFQKRKNKLLIDKMKQQQAFEEELSITQLEIQEQTLKNIGQELHDNVGQILSVANMNLSILNTQVPEDIKESFTETKNAVKQGLSELRALSKSLNSDVISNRGFQKSVETEIERLNKLKLLNSELKIEGNPANFVDGKDSIILFRIIQEFISNTVKYAEAKTLEILLNFKEDALEINALDDGKGFDILNIEKGAGLINMNSRAELIKSTYSLNSEVGKGVRLALIYPYKD